jgi:tripartite-type tricarboxylate transporter receptor subunit TctC
MKSAVRKAKTHHHRVATRDLERRLATQHPRRRILSLAADAVALSAASGMAWAQAYPARPVRIIVGFPAGGGADITARLIGQWLSERLGRPFIIENRAGANANIATEAVAKSRPDGYTLLLAGSYNATNATLYDNLIFNFIRDVVPVAPIMRAPYVMEVNPSVPVNTLPEFIDYAKANPGKINMASGGVGNATHICGELFKLMADIDLVHVPYRGSAPAMADLLGGHVQVIFDGLLSSIEHIRAGKLRPLGVTTAMRSTAVPDLPAIGESLPGFEASLWYGLGAPRSTPPEIIDKLNKEVNVALADPKIRERLAEQGSAAMVGSSADFGRFIAEETEKWAKVIQAANIKGG